MGRASRVKPKRLAEKLSTIRAALGITHEELIKRLDCEEIPLYRASISQYESGKIEPPLPVLLRYARIINVYVDTLIDDKIDLPKQIPATKKSSIEWNYANSYLFITKSIDFNIQVNIWF